MATDAKEREREALEAAHKAARLVVKLSDGCGGDCEAKPDECATKRLFGAILAYGRAVREADKEAAQAITRMHRLAAEIRNHMKNGSSRFLEAKAIGADGAAGAVEALEERDGEGK